MVSFRPQGSGNLPLPNGLNNSLSMGVILTIPSSSDDPPSGGTTFSIWIFFHIPVFLETKYSYKKPSKKHPQKIGEFLHLINNK